MKLYRITRRQNKLKKTGPANRNDTKMTVRNTTQSSLSTEYRRTVTRHDFATQATPYSSDASDRQTTTSQLGNVTDLTIRPRQLPRTHVLLVELQQLGRLESPTSVSRPR